MGFAFATTRLFRVFVCRPTVSSLHRALIVASLVAFIGSGSPATAATSAADARLQQAVTWATQQMVGPKLWLDGGVTLCDQFVENAFGVTAQYPTAYDMYLALGKTAPAAQHSIASLKDAPAGAIVFFDRNAGNFQDGHVGLYIGDGQFVGVVTGGHVKPHPVQWWDDKISHFLGWAYPPADWPGVSKAKPISRAAPVAPPAPTAQAAEAAKRAFQAQWQGGEAIARNLWGPSLTTPANEAYAEAAGGYRVVQYYDKGRMELSDPKAGTVTNGLLASELITGRVQIGKETFQTRNPAAIPIAGDADTPGPTYAMLNGRAAKMLQAAPAKTGTMIEASVSAYGTITEAAPTGASDVRIAAKSDTALAAYDSTTQHNLPAAFALYRVKVGIGVIGYARSEPFVATVKVAGVQRQVVVQVFERRVLTYTASNPDPFKVEMGNIGQHYRRWRYDA